MCNSERWYNNRLAALNEIDLQIKELEAKRDAIKAKITEDMGELEAFETGKYRVFWTKVLGSRFDSKAFKAADSRTYELYCKPTETRRFTYTVK